MSLVLLAHTCHSSRSRLSRSFSQYLVAIQKGTRVLISLWDSLMFGRVPGTRIYYLGSRRASPIAARKEKGPCGARARKTGRLRVREQDEAGQDRVFLNKKRGQCDGLSSGQNKHNFTISEFHNFQPVTGHVNGFLTKQTVTRGCLLIPCDTT